MDEVRGTAEPGVAKLLVVPGASGAAQLLTEAGTRRVLYLSKLTCGEMDLLCYPATATEIDVCEGLQND